MLDTITHLLVIIGIAGVVSYLTIIVGMIYFVTKSIYDERPR